MHTFLKICAFIRTKNHFARTQLNHIYLIILSYIHIDLCLFSNSSHYIGEISQSRILLVLVTFKKCLALHGYGKFSDLAALSIPNIYELINTN